MKMIDRSKDARRASADLHEVYGNADNAPVAVSAAVRRTGRSRSTRPSYLDGVPVPAFVETDSQGRVVLPGHPNNRYLMRVNADGSIHLRPATVMTLAQHEFDSTPGLQSLLAPASATSTIRRARDHRV
jgi:hypothetical protein